MNFIKRVLIGVLLLIYTFISIYLNGPYIYIMVLLFSLIGTTELMRAFKNELNGKINYFIYLFTIILTICAYFKKYEFYIVSIILFMLIEFILLTINKNTIKRMTLSIFILLYISGSFSLILLMKESILIHFIYIIAWGTDSLAYLIGVTLGKTKLAPNLSPNKTLEGSIGGIIGAIVLSIIYASYLDFSLILTGALAFILSIFSQIGDLSASKLKRTANIKDYGHIFRAHGGVLDRYDSILFIIPIIYLFHIIGGF